MMIQRGTGILKILKGIKTMDVTLVLSTCVFQDITGRVGQNKGSRTSVRKKCIENSQ